MLTIGKLGAGQERYYLEKVADGAEDYYSGRGESKGRWRGDGARELGLEGEVEPDQLRTMLTGRDPRDGEPLLGSSGVRGRGPVPGFDLTFSAPKSVSLLWALGDEETARAVTEAHERSLDAALGYLEREACWTRRGAGGRTFVEGSGFLAAAYRHRTSRNGDPQLHTHVLVANATQGPDGRFTRLHHPSIYEHAKTAGYLYEAELRHQLTRELGLSWQEPRNGIAELLGFEDHQLRHFSTRRAEILRAAGPQASARSRQVAALATRAAKPQTLEQPALRERWAERAREVDLDVELQVLFLADPGRAARRPVLDLDRLDRAVTAGASHFDRRDAIQAVAQSLADGGEGRAIERAADEYLASERVVAIGEGPKGEVFTTARIWELEREALAASRQLGMSERAAAGGPLARQITAARPSLTADQRRMVERLLTDPEGLAVVIGEAGTGKSHAIAAAAEGWERAGIPLRAAAPTWQAANVLRGEGVAATSIARLLNDLDESVAWGLAPLPRDSVLLVDEAAMVDSGTLARLVHHADSADAKLVLVGDPKQLPEIEAGGLFSAIADRGDPIRLSDPVRHERALDRETLALIREGRGGEALELYRASERVTVARDVDAKRGAMVADWWGSFSRGDDAVMLCRTNAEVEQLNGIARALMREEGRLGEAELEVGGQPFAAGDQVVTRVNSPAHEVHNRERWTVSEVDPERRRIVLAGVDHERSALLDADYLAAATQRGGPSLEHAYASNLYLAQGRTVDRAFVAAEPAMGQGDFYVALSRAREETRLYAVAEPELAREEYAPREPWERDVLAEVREAIERPTAQLGALDEARSAEISQQPSADLAELRESLKGEIGHAEFLQRRERMAAEELEHAREHLAQTEARVDALARGSRRERRELKPHWERAEEIERRQLAELEAEAERREPAPEIAPERRAELAAVERELDGRLAQRITADRLSPPDYITRELGERPSEPALAAHWERGVNEIERYRQAHSISDPGHALGSRPRESSQERDWEQAHERLADRQHELGREQDLERIQDRELRRSLELVLEGPSFFGH